MRIITTFVEIDSIIGKNTGAYLAKLEITYSHIVRNKPIFAKPESRKTRWAINDNYLNFWFRFIFPNQSLIEMGKYDLLREYIYNNYKQYSGSVLERYFRNKIADNERVTKIGSYWDNKGINEIDIVAINNIDKSAIIAEVKRKADKINIEILKTKAITVKELAKYSQEFRGLSLEDM
ncbi:MAG: DUF234 domain-containing protein [Bacteroidales bacterium]